ncbi:MAG: MFS transporter [Gammaproteobacteria bacterium]|nr:MFS transporter [Gammaproteobacteria bacterium]
MNDVASEKFYGWNNVGLLFVIYFAVMGMVFYGFNVIFPAMITDMGWGRGDAAFAHTIRGLLVGFTAPLVAIILNKYGSRNTLVIGLFVMSAGLFLLGIVVTELWHWILIWGFLMPIGFALGGLLPVQATVMYWFSAKRSTAMGLVMTAAAVGGLLAQPMYVTIIERSESWRVAWMVAGGFALVAAIAALWIKSKPEDFGQHPDGVSPEDVAVAAAKAPSKTFKTSIVWDLKDVIRTKTLWYLLIMFLAQIMPLYLIMVHGVFHLTDIGYSKMEAASILSFIIGGSGLAKFPIGWLGDRIEPRWIMTFLYTVMLLAFIGIWQAPSLSWLLVVGPVFGFCYGGAIVMMPTMIANYYSAQSFPAVNGFMFPIQIGLAATVPVGAGYLADTLGSYDIAFMILAGVLAVSCVCALLAAPPVSKTDASEGDESVAV